MVCSRRNQKFHYERVNIGFCIIVVPLIYLCTTTLTNDLSHTRTVNNIEDYVWDEEKQNIKVSFKYSGVNSDGKLGSQSEIKQVATVSNGFNTEWSLAVKMIVYIPINIRYLVLDVDDEYRYCLVGVADRSMLWIMCRSVPETALANEAYGLMLTKARTLGYDTTKVERIPYIDPEKHSLGNLVKEGVSASDVDIAR